MVAVSGRLASHCCKWCKKDVHSAIICSTVLSLREGAYFCNLACLRKYNRNPIGNGRQERMPEERREGEPVCTRADGHGGGREEESCSKAAAAAAGQNWQRVGVAPAAAASSGVGPLAAAAGAFTLEDIDDFVYDEMVLAALARDRAQANAMPAVSPEGGMPLPPSSNPAGDAGGAGQHEGDDEAASSPAGAEPSIGQIEPELSFAESLRAAHLVAMGGSPCATDSCTDDGPVEAPEADRVAGRQRRNKRRLRLWLRLWLWSLRAQLQPQF
eukprot:scaffold1630_cov109-Isochrysis_galbana.AAC.2